MRLKIILVVVGCMGITACSKLSKPRHTDMPPGWKLQTGGGEWRWVAPDGSSWIPLDSRQEAIDNAWDTYEYREPNWKSAK